MPHGQDIRHEGIKNKKEKARNGHWVHEFLKDFKYKGRNIKVLDKHLHV